MPSPKRMDRYPDEYFKLFTKVADKGRVVITCPNARAASNLRDRLYAFRKTYVKAATGMPGINQDAIAVARRFKFSLDGSRVIVRLTEQGEPLIAEALRK